MESLDTDAVVRIFGVAGTAMMIFFGVLEVMFRIQERKRRDAIKTYVLDEMFDEPVRRDNTAVRTGDGQR